MKLEQLWQLWQELKSEIKFSDFTDLIGVCAIALAVTLFMSLVTKAL